jgi:thiamine-phosphate pyrophosphorylase
VPDSRRERLERARLYLVCDDRTDEFLHAALSGGVDIVQLRMKDAGDDAVLAAARRFARACRQHGALLILNDRPHLVPIAQADGVHVGQDDVHVADARRAVGDDGIVGLSTHTPEQVHAAGEGDVDYIGVGPVYETPTKPGRAAVGLELVQYAARHAQVPFFAIGGIAPHNVGAVRSAGATRVAVVRALTEADDPRPVAQALKQGVVESTEASVGAATSS